MFAPLAIFTFNRPFYLEKCINSLKLNKLSSKTKVYFFIDYPKVNEDFHNYAKVKKIIKETNFFKKKIIIERKYNFGLRKNLLSGINYVLNKNETIIVLEDDLYLSKQFLNYMNKYLNFFKKSKNIASIHGYCYPIDKKNLENFFLIRGADCWGWATWRRAWKHYNDDHLFLSQEIKRMGEIKTFNFNNTFNYYDTLKNRLPSTWAVNWYASAFIKGMLTLYPKNSHVQNLGNSGIGEHSTKVDKSFDVSLSKKFIFEKIIIKENLLARKKFEKFFKKTFFLKRIESWPILNIFLRFFKN